MSELNKALQTIEQLRKECEWYSKTENENEKLRIELAKARNILNEVDFHWSRGGLSANSVKAVYQGPVREALRSIDESRVLK